MMKQSSTLLPHTKFHVSLDLQHLKPNHIRIVYDTLHSPNTLYVSYTRRHTIEVLSISLLF